MHCDMYYLKREERLVQKSNVSSSRGVMENTSYVLVVGEGAQRLADKLGVEEVEEDWLITDYAR